LLILKKIDSAISQIEHEVANLKREMNKPKIEHKHAATRKNRTIIEQIYDENKEKATAALEEVSIITPLNSIQPVKFTSLSIYQETIKKNMNL